MRSYTVKLQLPAVNEEYEVEAGSTQQAKEQVIYAALERQFRFATVTVIEVHRKHEPQRTT